MVISAAASWTERSVIGNDRLIALLYTGVGYDHIDVKALTDAGRSVLLLRPMLSAVPWRAPS